MNTHKIHAALGATLCLLAAGFGFGAVPVFAAGADASGKHGNASVFYGAVLVVSLLVVLLYVLGDKRRERKFVLLYCCVAVANLGYFLLSVADSLSDALWANRIGYFGSAYAVLIMLLVVAEICNIQLGKIGKAAFVGITSAAFLFASTGGWLDIYYTDVRLEIVDGVSRLVKCYAPLHILYTVYVLAYFMLMVAMILYARKKKTIYSTRYAMFVAAAVLGNIAVWGVEQLIDVEFEFLSISYIATELLLLLLKGLIQEYEKQAAEDAGLRSSAADNELPPNIEELFSSFAGRVATLTPTERMMLQYYIDGLSLEEIAARSYISINTAKKHNTNLNRKLDLKSREELSLYIDLFRRVGRLDDITYKH